MLSIEKCCKILNKEEEKYTKEQVKNIRQFLEQMALIEYELSKKDEDGRSDLHQSVNRGAKGEWI